MSSRPRLHAEVHSYDRDRIAYWRAALWWVVLGVLMWSCTASLLSLGRVWSDDDLLRLWLCNNVAHCGLRVFTASWLVATRRHRWRP